MRSISERTKINCDLNDNFSDNFSQLKIRLNFTRIREGDIRDCGSAINERQRDSDVALVVNITARVE